MFFGSAFNNFGVDLFLQSFISMAVAPGPAIAKGNPAVLQQLTAEQLMERKQAAEVASSSNSSSSASSSKSKKGSASKGGSSTGSNSVEGVVPPDSQHFSGLVFKLQANMDPKHRDKVWVKQGCCCCCHAWVLMDVWVQCCYHGCQQHCGTLTCNTSGGCTHKVAAKAPKAGNALCLCAANWCSQRSCTTHI
jgi:hypothetical protein